MIGTYMYGIIQCSPRPIHDVWALHNRKHPDTLDEPRIILKIEYLCFIAHAIFINYSGDKSDFFLRNISFNLPEYSYDPGVYRNIANISSDRSMRKRSSSSIIGQLLTNFRSFLSGMNGYMFMLLGL